jgi:hypothetical protein
MRTELKHNDPFSFVVLERQLFLEKIRFNKRNNILYAKRNLLWLSLAYCGALIAAFTFLV